MDLLSIKKALEENPREINDLFRPKYHMTPKVGWMNDPNGLIYFKNEYHLYFQSNPFHTKPGQMIWGHFVSPDLISFKELDYALALEKNGENAYSGGAIEVDNEINIFYTLHTEKHPHLIRFDGEVLDGDEVMNEEENEKRKTLYRPNEGKDVKEEDIYHSISKDGLYFDRGQLVFDNETLPENLSRTDFRDPNPVKIGDTYYLFVGGKDLELNQGVIIVLKSKTLDHFEYAFYLGPYYALGDMAECPSYMRIGDKDVIIVCGSNTPRKDNDFRNINSSIFIVGNLDFDRGTMKVDFIKEIDKGDSYYAPQFIRGTDRHIMVGWMEMWGKKYPTRRMHHGWVGAFSIPREITIKDGEIYQNPIKELDNYTRVVHQEYLPRQADMTLTIEEGDSFIIKGDNGELVFGNDGNGIYIDNTKTNSIYESIRHTNNRYAKCPIRILIDNSSIELFVNNGQEVITDRFYIEGDLKLIPSNKNKEVLIKEVAR